MTSRPGQATGHINKPFIDPFRSFAKVPGRERVGHFMGRQAEAERRLDTRALSANSTRTLRESHSPVLRTAVRETKVIIRRH